jgi:hypothetical protein
MATSQIHPILVGATAQQTRAFGCRCAALNNCAEKSIIFAKIFRLRVWSFASICFSGSEQYDYNRAAFGA